MNHRKLIVWTCTAAFFMCASGCGSESPDPTEIEMSAVTTDSGDTEESSSDTAVTTSAVTGTSGTAISTEVSGSGTSKTTSSSTTVRTTVKNSGGFSGGNQNNVSAGNNDSGNSTQNQSNGDGNQIMTTKSNDNTANTTTQAAVQTTVAETEPVEVDDTIYITLNGSGAQVSDSGAVSVSGSVITILQAGRYEVTGTLNDGQLIVDAGKESKVNLHLNGAGLTCSYAAALYVLSADTCVLHLDEGSSNYIQDTAGNTQSAAVLSKDDLTIKGNGALTVIGNVKHAVKSSNDVKIKSGSLTLSAVSTAIYGEDSVQISGGNITISACKDGIKSSNEEETDRGFVTVENAWIDIQNAAGNGIQAVTGVTISSGTVNVHSAKKAINCDYQSIADGCLFTY